MLGGEIGTVFSSYREDNNNNNTSTAGPTSGGRGTLLWTTGWSSSYPVEMLYVSCESCFKEMKKLGRVSDMEQAGVIAREKHGCLSRALIFWKGCALYRRIISISQQTISWLFLVIEHAAAPRRR